MAQTEISDRTYVYTTYIRATREKVFEALTTPEFTMQYWGGAEIRSDWQVGSPVEAYHPDHDDFVGEVLAVQPPDRLSYTFTLKSDRAAGRPATTVDFDISKFGDEAVKLTVQHSGFTADSHGESDHRNISVGWPAILAALKTLLETGEPMQSPGEYSPRRPAHA